MPWHCDVDYSRPDTVSGGASSALGGPGSGAGVMVAVGCQEQTMSTWGGTEQRAAKFDHAALNGMRLETQFWNFPFDIFGPSLTVGSWNIERETVAEEGLLYGGLILRRPFTERKARSLNTGSPKWVSKTLKQSTQNRAPTRNDWLRILWVHLIVSNLCFPGGSDVKESACSAGDLGLIPGLGRSRGEGNGYPLQYSCLANSTDRGAGGLQSMGLQRVRYNWATNACTSLSHLVVYPSVREWKLLEPVCYPRGLRPSSKQARPTARGEVTSLFPSLSLFSSESRDGKREKQ